MLTKTMIHNPDNFKDLWEQAKTELAEEFGANFVDGFHGGSTASLYIHRSLIDGLDPADWACQASIAMDCERGMRGYVYPIWRNTYACYRNSSTNMRAVNDAKPPWDSLEVGLSALIVRLRNIFPDAQFTFMDR
jgi:hypothetical protein